MIKLVGILIIIIGFMLKMDTIAVVIMAGVVTGLVAEMSVMDILSSFGKAFVDTRYMSIFLITLPAIGLLESNGLKNTATRLIQSIKKATVGNVIFIYMVVRTFLSTVGVRLGGHIQFIRPVLYPMLESIANPHKTMNNKKTDKLKSYSCAVENYGNFYGQNVFIANAGVLLIVGTLNEAGYPVKNTEIAMYSATIAIAAIVLVGLQISRINKSFMEK